MTTDGEGAARALEGLRAAWREGIESGDAGETDFDALRRKARARFLATRETDGREGGSPPPRG